MRAPLVEELPLTATYRERVNVAGSLFDPLAEREVVQHVRSALAAGAGGWIATPNTDMLCALARDHTLQELVQSASLVVADGMPIIWAGQLAGTVLPERVTGSSLICTLTEAMAADRRSVFLLGGMPGVPEAAAEALRRRFPGLLVAGTDSPPFGFERDAAELRRVTAMLADAAPDLVYVGLGFPKQEQLIRRLLTELPHSWLVGCGAAIAMAAGVTPRAPQWAQTMGLEWVHRLSQEPTRLAGRYLRRDLPFALRLLSVAALTRLRRQRQLQA